MSFEERNVQGQISEHIFASNGGYCVYYPSGFFFFFFATGAVLKIGEYSLSLRNIRSRDVFRPIAQERKYFMDYKGSYGKITVLTLRALMLY